MMLKNLLKKIGVFCLSLVFGLWTFFVALSVPVRADSLAWSLDLLGSGNPVADLLAAYDIIPILSAGGSIELAKFNTYDEWKEWWTDEMTSRIADPSDIEESLQAGVDAYRVAGVSSLTDQDSLFAKVNQRYLAMQIGYAKDFVDNVTVLSDSEPPPAPSPDFSFLSNTVDWVWGNNNSGLYTFGSGLPISPNFSTDMPSRVPSSNWSFLAFYDNSSSNNSFGSIALCPRTFGSIYITDNGSGSAGSVSLRYVGFNSLSYYLNVGSWYLARISPAGANSSRLYFDNSALQNNGSTYSLPWSFRTSFDGLSTACNYIFRNFRHIDIYYNGDPWVLANPPVADPDPVSFPDVIRTGDGDLAYDLVVPDTDTGDAYFDLTALLSRIYDMINDNSSTADKTLTLEDVQDLLVDKEGTQVATKSVVVSKVIADSLDITGSPPAPSGVPVDSFDHPVLYFPPVDSGSGSSILAELIHATDVALPDDLMLAVWGALGALFVLGVIHILHK